VVGGADVFVARYSPSGEHRWSRSFGSSVSDSVADVAVDDLDNIYFVGSHQGTIDFGGGALAVTGDRDGYVVSLTGGGSYRWAQEIDSSISTAVDAAWSIGVANSRVFVSGLTLSSSSAGGATLICGGSAQAMFLVAYGTDGSPLWGKCFGAAGFSSARGLGVDAAGNVTITGYYDGNPDLGGGALPASAGLDLFIASFDMNGSYRWARGMGGGADDWGNRVATDSAGNVFATGFFEGGIDFGGGLLSASGQIDGYVASFSSTGSYRWARRVGGSNCDQTRGVAVDASGKVYATGVFAGSLMFAGQTLTAVGTGDAFVVTYDNAGAELEARLFGGALSDEVLDLDVTHPGVIVIGRSGSTSSQCRNQPDSAEGELYLGPL
jgi:hypothetical protein